MAAIRSTTIWVKKIIVGEWAIGLLLMIICEIIALATFFQNGNTTDYTDKVAQKLLQLFLAVNVVELLFWVLGLMTLKY